MPRRRATLGMALVLPATAFAQAPPPTSGGIVDGQRLQPRPEVVREREVGLNRSAERERRDQQTLDELRAERERRKGEEAEGRVPPNPVAPPR